MFDSRRLLPERRWLLFQGAVDFFDFQNGPYPRRQALDLVGNRYSLDAFERMLLRRGVYGQKDALSRRAKRELGDAWRSGLLVVDGHNVQITVESHIEGKPLLRSNDGAMRDLAGMSSRFRLGAAGELAMDMIFRFLGEFRPREVVFLFDEPMSRSGELASIYRRRLGEMRIPGDARAVPVPEREMVLDDCVAASSDSAVLDASARWLDLACRIIDHSGFASITADFSALVSRSARNQLFREIGPSL
ncbi:MAG: DUF434 domain-containing protein [Desulfobacteraceae bacterium]|nr:DUF434 domain-containing protein [Desulfobacteraceae bacterium]